MAVSKDLVQCGGVDSSPRLGSLLREGAQIVQRGKTLPSGTTYLIDKTT